MIKKLWEDLRTSPFQTIDRWQDARFLWLLMAGISLFMVILAHSVFQHWLYMKPCEQCVYIRYAFFCIALGGIVAVINPKKVALKAIGYFLAFYGMIKGVLYSIKLNSIHHAAHGDDPFGVQGCSTDPSFPFGLPLHQIAPDWFNPTGDCGFDNPIVPSTAELSAVQQWLVDFYADGWYLWPPSHFMNMAQACLITFGVCLLFLGIAAVAWLVVGLRHKKPVAVAAAS